MKHISIYRLNAIDRKSGNEFSLGCYQNRETALKHKQIQDSITGKEYRHFVEEDILFLDEDQIKNYIKKLFDSIF